MKKQISLSLVCALAINSYAADLGKIEVKEVLDTKIIENVSQNEVKNADLAQTLFNEVPSINMIRRSAIANDITLRGQKRDNITVTVDDAKIYGACPNRMDPPTSHIVTSNIDLIKVSEGPFDVEDFGTLSGSVKIQTKKPSSKKLTGDIQIGIGSFGYQKFGINASGGNDKIKVLFSGSTQTSEQYKDGNGDTLAEQLKNATDQTAQASMQYADKYKDMDAYTKKSGMLKTFININDKSDIELSYTANRSDDILYANSKMDAIYDDSDIINFKYTIRNLNKYSKKLKIEAYNSTVTHPMSTKYRKSSGTNSENEVISRLTTDMTGVKIINDINIGNDLLTIGLDSSKRNWDGHYIGYGTKKGVNNRKSIDDVDTTNNAIFIKYNKDINNVNLKFGTRYNDTTISTANKNYSDRDFDSIDMNILATIAKNNSTNYFIGIGKASRVPDGRELYFTSSMNTLTGTPNLKDTTNTEIDMGVEKNYKNAYLKLKAFYSKLDDYIYIQKGKTVNAFTNIDAKIYGLELLGSYDINEAAYIDYGASYQRGKKDDPLPGQTDTDLADITPLKINLALNYDICPTLSTKIEYIHTNSWNKYDSDNGEQKLPSYNIINLKAKKTIKKKFEVIAGIDNLFDKTYAISNTYADLTLLTDGNSGDVMLLNEPGRYFYTNLKYKF